MPDQIEMATIKNVPMMTVGPCRLWKGGERVFTEAELIDCARAYNDPECPSPRLKLAHEHQLDTGEPAFGRYEGVRYDAEKKTLFGDLTGIPLWLAKVLPSAYPNRSVEAVENLETSLGKYRVALRAVGSLGIKMPAMKGLGDLAHWWTATTPAGVTLEAASGMPDPWYPHTASHDRDKELNVEIRKQLGLAEDATDEQVTAKLAEIQKIAVDARTNLGLAATATDAEVTAKLAELAKIAADAKPTEAMLEKIKADALIEARAAVVAEAEAATAAAAAAEAARVAAGGKPNLVTVEAGAFEEMKANSLLGKAAHDAQVLATRNELLDRKLAKGAIAPASREGLLNALEAGAIDEKTIEALPEGLIPVDGKTLGTSTDLEATEGGVKTKPEDIDKQLATDGWLTAEEAERVGLKQKGA